MLTAIASGFFGLASSLVPDVLKEIRESRDHTRETAFLKLQHQLAMERADREMTGKMHEHDATTLVEETRAWKEHLTAIVEAQSKPTGIAWIDGLNSALRPATAAVFIITIPILVLGFSEAIPREVFAPLYVEAIQAVLGFVFGYRSGRKLPVIG